jgi:hypothetical protein
MPNRHFPPLGKGDVVGQARFIGTLFGMTGRLSQRSPPLQQLILPSNLRNETLASVLQRPIIPDGIPDAKTIVTRS